MLLSEAALAGQHAGGGIVIWTAARWTGVVLLSAAGLFWASVVVGLSTFGLGEHPAGAILGGTTVLTVVPLVSGTLLYRAGVRRHSATTNLLVRVAGSTIALVRLFIAAPVAAGAWVKRGGPRATVSECASTLRLLSQDLRTIQAIAKSAAIAAYRERGEPHRERREAEVRARADRVPPSIPLPDRTQVTPLARVHITPRWMFPRPPVHPHAVILRTGRRGSRLGIIGLLLLLGGALFYASVMTRSGALLVFPVVCLAYTWRFAWQEIAELHFEPAALRFVAPLRQVLVLPGEVIELRRKGSWDGDTDDRHLSVITAGCVQDPSPPLRGGPGSGDSLVEPERSPHRQLGLANARRAQPTSRQARRSAVGARGAPGALEAAATRCQA